MGRTGKAGLAGRPGVALRVVVGRALEGAAGAHGCARKRAVAGGIRSIGAVSEGGSHRTVLLAEAVEALNVRPEGVYVDATFGRGGHSRALLRQLGPHGRLIGLDRDPLAVAAGREWDDERFALVHAAFSRLSEVLR